MEGWKQGAVRVGTHWHFTADIRSRGKLTHSNTAFMVTAAERDTSFLLQERWPQLQQGMQQCCPRELKIRLLL